MVKIVYLALILGSLLIMITTASNHIKIITLSVIIFTLVYEILRSRREVVVT